MSGIAFECYGDNEVFPMVAEETEKNCTQEVHGKTSFISKAHNMLWRVNSVHFAPGGERRGRGKICERLVKSFELLKYGKQKYSYTWKANYMNYEFTNYNFIRIPVWQSL
jgi:hypothetical protein